ncbi:hypothetical protein CORC01_05266 [Colletotrichum orchidophilum]|uniref:Uncharacterized protein n=1 Tax=Colletotrichum orchidophilum TaxID=1209926 RepID=A0A1G4BDP2_9PEZI|nr:uncharacterized protein CORC01_05266 [Colletotrichum orchidophilum]OHE99466.1 hypothetical protein CORC01_05266 [Colletotrichum orchidophilum]
MHFFKAGLPILAVSSAIHAIPVSNSERGDTALHHHEGPKTLDMRLGSSGPGGIVPPHILRNITRSPFTTDDERDAANRTLEIDEQRRSPGHSMAQMVPPRT